MRMWDESTYEMNTSHSIFDILITPGEMEF